MDNRIIKVLKKVNIGINYKEFGEDVIEIYSKDGAYDVTESYHIIDEELGLVSYIKMYYGRTRISELITIESALERILIPSRNYI